MIRERCAALDARNGAVTACVRRPEPQCRGQEVREFRALTSCLRRLIDWLAAERVTRIAMDVTGRHWLPVWQALEGLDGVDLLLVNAHHVKTLPGRQTDVCDACWLAQLLDYGLLRGCVVSPCDVARLRDVTRYRQQLIEDRAREVRRVRDVLESAGVDLDNVPAGEQHDDAMADTVMAVGQVCLAAEGQFEEHRACMLGVSFAHLAHLGAAIAHLDEEVGRLTHPFPGQIRRPTNPGRAATQAGRD